MTDWAKIVQPAVNTPPKAPAYQMVQRAVIQIAVYDAVMAIEGGFKPFTANVSSSPEHPDVRYAAAIAAWLTPRSRVDPSKFLIWTPSTPPISQARRLPGPRCEAVLWANGAAAAILARRANDGLQ